MNPRQCDKLFYKGIALLDKIKSSMPDMDPNLYAQFSKLHSLNKGEEMQSFIENLKQIEPKDLKQIEAKEESALKPIFSLFSRLLGLNEVVPKAYNAECNHLFSTGVTLIDNIYKTRPSQISNLYADFSKLHSNGKVEEMRLFIETLKTSKKVEELPRETKAQIEPAQAERGYQFPPIVSEVVPKASNAECDQLFSEGIALIDSLRHTIASQNPGLYASFSALHNNRQVEEMRSFITTLRVAKKAEELPQGIKAKIQAESVIEEQALPNSEQKNILEQFHEPKGYSKSKLFSSSSPKEDSPRGLADKKEEAERDFSDGLKAYLKTFENKPNPIAEMSLTEDEIKKFEDQDLIDPISEEPLWAPVIINGIEYNLKSLLDHYDKFNKDNFALDPVARKPFSLNQIQEASHKTGDRINKLIQSIRDDREKSHVIRLS